MKRLYRLTPHRLLSRNPLFTFEVRRVRWGQSAQSMLTYSGRLMLVVCAVLMLLWLLVSFRDIRQNSVGDFVILLLGASFLASLALDTTSMASALGSINGEITSGRWDLLRLTLLTVPQIVAAKHGAAQVRAWRLMTLIIALRVAVLLMALASFLLILVHSRSFNGVTAAQTLNAIIGQLVITVLGILYILEPWWRMRTVTALGVAISARARQPISVVLAAGGAVFGLWLLQGFVALVVAFGVGLIILPLTLLEASVNQLVICSPLIFLILIIAIVYGFYSIVQTWGLRSAERWINRVSEPLN
jgi:hypothetical protein